MRKTDDIIRTVQHVSLPVAPLNARCSSVLWQEACHHTPVLCTCQSLYVLCAVSQARFRGGIHFSTSGKVKPQEEPKLDQRIEGATPSPCPKTASNCASRPQIIRHGYRL